MCYLREKKPVPRFPKCQGFFVSSVLRFFVSFPRVPNAKTPEFKTSKAWKFQESEIGCMISNSCFSWRYLSHVQDFQGCIKQDTGTYWHEHFSKFVIFDISNFNKSKSPNAILKKQDFPTNMLCFLSCLTNLREEKPVKQQREHKKGFYGFPV